MKIKDRGDFILKNLIRNYLLIIYNIVRFSFIKLVTSAKIDVDKKILLSSKVKIKLSKNSKLKIGAIFIARENVNIEVCENAYLSLGKNSFLNKNCEVVAREKIIIGDNTGIGPNVLIYDNDHDFRKKDKSGFTTKEIIIGSNCWIGGNCVILKGTIIGDNCVIGAGTVIKGTIPNNSLVLNKQNLIIKDIKTKEDFNERIN